MLDCSRWSLTVARVYWINAALPIAGKPRSYNFLN